MRISQAFFPLVAATLLVTGCSSREPANRVISQAEAGVEKVRPDASLYAPDQIKVVDDHIATMKADFAKKDYKAVIAAVPDFNNEMNTVKESIASGQTLASAAQTEWETLNQEVPKSVEAIQARVDTLAAAKLPKGISKETFETAKTDFEAAKATWAEATAAASSGKALEAASKGRTVQAKTDQLKNQLGMNAAVASIAAPARGTTETSEPAAAPRAAPAPKAAPAPEPATTPEPAPAPESAPAPDTTTAPNTAATPDPAPAPSTN